MPDTQAFAEVSSRSAAELAEKYLALWNEPDVDRRRRMIAELWTEDGRHILQPPQEIRGIAAQPGIAHDGDPRGTGPRGDRGSRGERRTSTGSAPRGSASAGATTPNDSATSSSSTGRRSPRTARCSRSGSTSSSSPRTAGSSATTRSSSLEDRSCRSQCHGGRHPGRSDGRHQAGERADQDGRGDAARPGLDGDHDGPALRAGVDGRCHGPGQHADDAADDGEQDRLARGTACGSGSWSRRGRDGGRSPSGVPAPR